MILGPTALSADDTAVARRDLDSVKELLPQLLGKLARESGRARHLAAVWEDAVGAQIAQNARPLIVEGDALVLTVTSARWAHELEARAPALCARLTERLGDGIVTRLVFRFEESTVTPEGRRR